eukprot:TRINITY_DN842_c0_g1_i2.p1 TRINITY_DN842_c0_g1~~TRINITY_DN842_c0_g1_i2.p1  ORF type:complete len:262 (-),score=86.43 TRINITY_DN842_c0_g1_i2:73-828(-)
MNDYQALRGYVLGAEDPKQIAPEGQVRLDVISEVLNGSVSNSANNWKNFQLDVSVSDFKKKLELFVGTAPQYQRLELYNPDGTLFTTIEDDEKKLQDFQPQNGMKIFVKDTDPNNQIANLQDTSKVEKYTMSDESYSNREVTYKKWKEQNPTAKPESATIPEGWKIGDRCEVDAQSGSDLKRRGTVKFLGQIDGQAGFWVGVQLDEPLGKNDGSVKGKRYFECPDKYGSFLRPDKVVVGDFPEEDLFDDEL